MKDGDANFFTVINCLLQDEFYNTKQRSTTKINVRRSDVYEVYHFRKEH